MKDDIFLWKNYCKVAYKLDPDFTVSQWANEKRVLTSKASAEAGKWRTERTPYLREIMDVLSPNSGYDQVIFMKAAQLGGTECGNNWMGYCMDLAPGPILVVHPTVDLAKKWSRQRLMPMIQGCEALKGKIAEVKSRDTANTILVKDFIGGILMITGANSAAGLRGHPIRYLYLEEIDAYPLDVGGEGDPVDVAERRTAGFARRKIFQVSSPTIQEFSKIEKLYSLSDQRKYHVPCPLCGCMQELKWSGIVWKEKNTGDVRYRCEGCEELIEERHKAEMLARGDWVKMNPESRIAGFHLNALYAPPGWHTSWREVVEGFLNAVGNPLKQKTWTNTMLGETWNEGETAIASDALQSRQEEYKAEVPGEVLVLTGAVDVQDDRLEAEVVGWGLGEESWGIDFKQFWGSPARPEVWGELDRYLQRSWQHELGIKLPVACTCIDTGYNTPAVYKFVKPREQRKIYGIKGQPNPGKPFVGRPTKSSRERINLFPIGVDSGKDMIYGRLKIKEPGPGYMHFPNLECYDEEFFKQLTSEKSIVKYYKGVPIGRIWQKGRARNEALDLRVYGYAALVILNPNLKMLQLKINEKVEKMKGTKPDEGKESEPEKGSGGEIEEFGRHKVRVGKWMGMHKRGGWMGQWK